MPYFNEQQVAGMNRFIRDQKNQPQTSGVPSQGGGQPPSQQGQQRPGPSWGAWGQGQQQQGQQRMPGFRPSSNGQPQWGGPGSHGFGAMGGGYGGGFGAMGGGLSNARQFQQMMSQYQPPPQQGTEAYGQYMRKQHPSWYDGQAATHRGGGGMGPQMDDRAYWEQQRAQREKAMASGMGVSMDFIPQRDDPNYWTTGPGAKLANGTGDLQQTQGPDATNGFRPPPQQLMDLFGRMPGKIGDDLRNQFNSQWNNQVNTNVPQGGAAGNPYGDLTHGNMQNMSSELRNAMTDARWLNSGANQYDQWANQNQSPWGGLAGQGSDYIGNLMNNGAPQYENRFMDMGYNMLQQGPGSGPQFPGAPQQQQMGRMGPGGMQNQFDPNSVQGPNIQNVDMQRGDYSGPQMGQARTEYSGGNVSAPGGGFNGFAGQQPNIRDVNAPTAQAPGQVRAGGGDFGGPQHGNLPSWSDMAGMAASQAGMAGQGGPQNVGRENMQRSGYAQDPMVAQRNQMSLGAMQGGINAANSLANTQAMTADLTASRDKIFEQAAQAGYGISGEAGFGDPRGTMAGRSMGKQLGLAAAQMAGEEQQRLLAANQQALSAQQGGAGLLSQIGGTAGSQAGQFANIGLNETQGLNSNALTQRGQDIGQNQFAANFNQNANSNFAQNLNAMSSLYGAMGNVTNTGFGLGTQRGLGQGAQSLEAQIQNQNTMADMNKFNAANQLQAGMANQQGDIAGANIGTQRGQMMGNWDMQSQMANQQNNQFGAQFGQTGDIANQNAQLNSFNAGTARGAGMDQRFLDAGMGNAANQIGGYNAATGRIGQMGDYYGNMANIGLQYDQLDSANMNQWNAGQRDIFGQQSQNALGGYNAATDRWNTGLNAAGQFGGMQQNQNAQDWQRQMDLANLGMGAIGGHSGFMQNRENNMANMIGQDNSNYMDYINQNLGYEHARHMNRSAKDSAAMGGAFSLAGNLIPGMGSLFGGGAGMAAATTGGYSGGGGFAPGAGYSASPSMSGGMNNMGMMPSHMNPGGFAMPYQWQPAP